MERRGAYHCMIEHFVLVEKAAESDDDVLAGGVLGQLTTKLN
jgi:hypothetical protein